MLTKEEKEMIIIGLQMRSNYVQTGNFHLSLRDLEAMGEETFKSVGGEIKALSFDQMQLCINTEKLITKIMNQL
jgi:hypothetical protein